MDFILVSLATLVGIYMAVNIGSNDLANAMGTSVGSGALTLRKAVAISIVANVLGAVLAGGYVTSTISKGIIDPSLLAPEPMKLALGMFASLLAAGLWVNLATFLALPISTTHAIVGAVVGFGILSVGIAAVSWGKIISIVASWVISPAVGGLIAGAIYSFVRKRITFADDPLKASERYGPFLLFLVFLVLILSVIFKGLKNLHLELNFIQTMSVVLPLALTAGFLGRKWVRWNVGKELIRSSPRQGVFSPVDRIFAQLQVITASYVAFAHGANDVANAVGPLAAIISVIKTKEVGLQVHVAPWMLIVGGIAVGGGLLFFGIRVIQTIGKKITEITPLRGFCAEFGAATTILICSRLGLPVSTTHVLVGAVVGIGFMRGMGNLDLRILKNIGISWIVTLPFTVFLSMALYKILTLLLI